MIQVVCRESVIHQRVSSSTYTPRSLEASHPRAVLLRWCGWVSSMPHARLSIHDSQHDCRQRGAEDALTFLADSHVGLLSAGGALGVLLLVLGASHSTRSSADTPDPKPVWWRMLLTATSLHMILPPVDLAIRTSAWTVHA